MNEMKYYNTERKLRYIDVKINMVTLDEHLIRMVLSRPCDFETEKGKDVCDFTEKEAVEYLVSLNKRTYDALNSEYYIITQYIDWCLSQGFVIDGQNHFKTLTVDMVRSCVNLMAADSAIITKKEFLQNLKYLENPRDQFIMLMAFEVGIKDSYRDIRNVSIEDFKERSVALTGRKACISSKLYQLAREADEETKYYVNEKFFSYLIPNGHIVKYTRTSKDKESEMKRQAMYRLFIKNLSDMGYEGLRPKDIEKSGIIHMVKQLAKQHKMRTRDVVADKQLYGFICRQYDFKMYWSTFWSKYERWLE